MNTRSHSFRLRGAILLATGLVLVPVLSAIAFPVKGGQADISAVRNATAKYHDVEAAKADGYGEFYVCTDKEGVGAMGQHYVKGALVDPVNSPGVDPLHPEALVYEPRPDGSLKLVAAEYVTFQDAYHAAFGANATPTVLGTNLIAVGAGNRYGLPPFFERHVWLWSPNPLGIYDDWNPRVSCRGNGDPAV
jgi:hypothetical protein